MKLQAKSSRRVEVVQVQLLETFLFSAVFLPRMREMGIALGFLRKELVGRGPVNVQIMHFSFLIS